MHVLCACTTSKHLLENTWPGTLWYMTETVRSRIARLTVKWGTADPAQSQRETLLPHCFPDSKVRSALGMGVTRCHGWAGTRLVSLWSNAPRQLRDYVTKSSQTLAHHSGTWALHSSLDYLPLWPCQKCLVWFRFAVFLWTKRTGQLLVWDSMIFFKKYVSTKCRPFQKPNQKIQT